MHELKQRIRIKKVKTNMHCIARMFLDAHNQTSLPFWISFSRPRRSACFIAWEPPGCLATSLEHSLGRNNDVPKKSIEMRTPSDVCMVYGLMPWTAPKVMRPSRLNGSSHPRLSGVLTVVKQERG